MATEEELLRVLRAASDVCMLVNFAYDRGYHELGYRPEQVLFERIASLEHQVAEREEELRKLIKEKRGH